MFLDSPAFAGIYEVSFQDTENKENKFDIRVTLIEDEILWNFTILENDTYNLSSERDGLKGHPSIVHTSVDETNKLMKIGFQGIAENGTMDGYAIIPIPGGSIVDLKNKLGQ